MNNFANHDTLLRCPISGENLRGSLADEVLAINSGIRDGRRRARDGSIVPRELEMALQTHDGRFVYRVADDVACLLPDLAIVQGQDVSPCARDDESASVRRFYDELGWMQRADGTYEDTALFTEANSVADSYRKTCNRRIGKQLRGGRYLLDVASGAIPHPEYLDLCGKYDFRICMDFSMRALLEARKKLGGKAICVLGDITCLPLRTCAVDDAISLHTIYHVPVSQQTKAVDELVRVTKPGGRAVVVYTWSRSPAMEAVFKVRGALGTVRRVGKPSLAAVGAGAHDVAKPVLYFHPQNVAWYDREIRNRHPSKLMVWSVVSTTFQQRFFRSPVIGLLAVRLVKSAEAMAPSWCGRYGQYPMFVIDRNDGPPA